MKSIKYIFLFIGIFSSVGWSQVDSLPIDDSGDFQDLIEDFILAAEGGDFDFNTLMEEIEHYRTRPINLNKATREQLRELQLLSELHINRLFAYRETAGDLIAIYELQAIPGWDLNLIRAILPFVTVGDKAFDQHRSVWEMIKDSRRELYIRTGRVLEEQRGFTDPGPNNASRFVGDPFNHFTRYRHTFENKLSLGFTGQKDPGEDFFTGINPYGFDFYSAHIFLRDYNSRLKSLALGDFAVSFGQGLLIHSGFATRKSAFVMNIKRGTRPLRPYTSIDENNFMRGAGITYGVHKNIDVTYFVSYKRRDANIRIDTLEDVDENVSFFSSILSSGFHRTPNEIENKNAVGHFTTGTSIQYDKGRFKLGLNALYDRFDEPFQRNQLPYNQFYFSGQELLNASLDYTYIFRNAHFFGETAISDNGAIATVNGLLAGLDKHVDVSVLYRYFPRDYHAILPNPFAETIIANNERGLYFGMEVRPDKHWNISAYADMWQHPWLRFQVDGLSTGSEYFARVTYTLKRRAEIYAQYRIKTRDRNDNAEAEDIKNRILLPHSREQIRLHFSNRVSKALELRSRVEFSKYRIGNNDPTGGFMIYQDVIYKPIGYPLSFTTRLALFDVDDFNSRIYAFENDVIYSFSIPAFFNQGMRYFLLVRYRGIRNVMIEFRVAQTYYTNIDEIGSGLNLIEGNTRTDAKIQVKFRF